MRFNGAGEVNKVKGVNRVKEVNKVKKGEVNRGTFYNGTINVSY